MATMSGKLLPKEDDEDQWISGEELRTEGSSDEDGCEPRLTRKKQKTDLLLKRLLVSSLTFPPLLPGLHKTDKVVKLLPSGLHEEVDDKQEDEKKNDAISTNFFESAKDFQAKSPRRVDVPECRCYEEDEANIASYSIMEIDEFYFEMMDRLKFLRSNLHKPHDANTYGKLSFDTFDQSVLAILADIARDEEEYQQNVQLMNKEKKEREAILEEICDRVKPTSSEESHNNNLGGGNRQRRAIIRYEKDFVARNKELAKEYAKMSRFCLTDEEKIKLETLLTDSGDEEQDGQDGRGDIGDIRGDQDAFVLDLDERKTLDELESKLKVLNEHCTVFDVQKEIDDIGVTVKLGKHWKPDLLEKRLKTIDKDLRLIRDEKVQEDIVSKIDNKIYLAEYRNCLADLGVDVDGETDEEDGESYEECLSQISLKVKEAGVEAELAGR